MHRVEILSQATRYFLAWITHHFLIARFLLTGILVTRLRLRLSLSFLFSISRREYFSISGQYDCDISWSYWLRLVSNLGFSISPKPTRLINSQLHNDISFTSQFYSASLFRYYMLFIEDAKSARITVGSCLRWLALGQTYTLCYDVCSTAGRAKRSLARARSIARQRPRSRRRGDIACDFDYEMVQILRGYHFSIFDAVNTANIDSIAFWRWWSLTILFNRAIFIAHSL